jgi:hypothetical protein
VPELLLEVDPKLPGWLLLSGEVGSVAAVLFRAPLVFSFVVLELELGLVLEVVSYVEPGVPYVEAEPVAELLDGYVELVPWFEMSLLEVELLEGEL